MARVLDNGGVASTGHYTSYSNNAVFTPGIPFPTMNLALNGHRPVIIYGIYLAYVSGGSGNYGSCTYQGATTAGPYLFPDSGGTIQMELRHGSGTTYFGLNGWAQTTYDSGDGSPFVGGGLSGNIQYAGVPSAPPIAVATVSGRTVSITVYASTDDGGAGISSYTVQYSTDGGSTWGGTVYGGSCTYNNLPPGDYIFRAYAGNEVGASAASITEVVRVRSGGKVRVDGAWVDGLAKVRVAGVWKDATVKVRESGAWHDAL